MSYRYQYNEQGEKTGIIFNSEEEYKFYSELIEKELQRIKEANIRNLREPLFIAKSSSPNTVEKTYPSNRTCTATEIQEQMRYAIMQQRIKEMESKILEKAKHSSSLAFFDTADEIEKRMDECKEPKAKDKRSATERTWSFADRSKIDVTEVKEDIQERLKGFTTSQLKMELDRRMKERR